VGPIREPEVEECTALDGLGMLARRGIPGIDRRPSIAADAGVTWIVFTEACA